MSWNEIAASGAAVFLSVVLLPQTGAAAPIHFPHVAARHFVAAHSAARPWVEGVTPSLENRLFDATYRVLPSHNVLKVYVFDAGGYESAGIRFSARVPHESTDLTDLELDQEAATLVRTTFEEFPQLQMVDVWGTIPVPASEATEMESTVFSVSADRSTYETIRDDKSLSDDAFLAKFGRLWVAPQVPQ